MDIVNFNILNLNKKIWKNIDNYILKTELLELCSVLHFLTNLIDKKFSDNKYSHAISIIENLRINISYKSLCNSKINYEIKKRLYYILAYMVKRKLEFWKSSLCLIQNNLIEIDKTLIKNRKDILFDL